jgi:hypothetical protein
MDPSFARYILHRDDEHAPRSRWSGDCVDDLAKFALSSSQRCLSPVAILDISAPFIKDGFQCGTGRFTMLTPGSILFIVAVEEGADVTNFIELGAGERNWSGDPLHSLSLDGYRAASRDNRDYEDKAL